MAFNSIIQRFRSHYNQKSNCKKTNSSRSNPIKRNPSNSNRKPFSKKHTITSQSQPSSIPIPISNQPILSSNFVEEHLNSSTLPLPPLSSSHNHSSLSLNTNSLTSKVVPTITNISRTAPSTPVTAKSSHIPHHTDHLETSSHLINSSSTSHLSHLSNPNHSHHDSSSSELSSPTSPTATSVPSHDSTHSFKVTKNTKRPTSQSRVKDELISKDLDELNTKLRPQASKSNSFWKRMSKSSTLMQINKKSSNESTDKLDMISQREQPDPTKQIDQENVQSERVKSTSNFNEMGLNSQTLGSEPHLTPQSSLNPNQPIINLTGVGTRNRNSFQKLPTSSSYTELSNHKRHSRPLSNYSPINSSPLSTQTSLHQDQDFSKLQRPTLRNMDKRSSYSSNRLSIIPDGSLTSSDDLMKLLRGPSPYPMEAQPQFFSNSAPNSRPVSRQSRLIHEI
ncbi:uncharacterized protein MELLADRAFT_71174 [Melampsora larici-populina 98AG31]|uniref:Uncharacterized protein n=1 Tax=Melampsora larici-populina (strain 98AG31 / pathotype 3-4-7) TaxID=747676 RepID=F4RD17_MELLP|nr:uncharacterized protein MELLADRAFT_71174 [Melampsora larici-populina 98AG31]EGG09822.1 hypothetical protein MELLADRAFT_71174 [Melampsora larici-populina 98AG31]